MNPAPSQAPPWPSRHVFSIDVEDWYQGLEIPLSEWGRFERRVSASMGDLLELMAYHGVRATCFVLGKVAEEHPQLVRSIQAAGHEVATHGYSHEKVYNLTPQRFREELRRSIQLLEDLTGDKVIGHRAPYFTITEQSLWALDILAEEGILYDSSIHPVFNYRYGIPNAARRPSYLSLAGGGRLLEIPVSTYPASRVNIPVGGGAYFRLYPYTVTRAALRRLERQGEGLSFYMHPWEVDPGHPHIPLPARVRATHYANLKSTAPKLSRLFRDFDFAPYREVYRSMLEEVAL